VNWPKPPVGPRRRTDLNAICEVLTVSCGMVAYFMFVSVEEAEG